MIQYDAYADGVSAVVAIVDSANANEFISCHVRFCITKFIEIWVMLRTPLNSIGFRKPELTPNV